MTQLNQSTQFELAQFELAQFELAQFELAQFELAQFELTQFVARPLPEIACVPRLEPVTQSSSLGQWLFRFFPKPQRRLYLGWFGGVQIYYKGGQP
jgi:hypothetical protein